MKVPKSSIVTPPVDNGCLRWFGLNVYSGHSAVSWHLCNLMSSAFYTYCGPAVSCGMYKECTKKIIEQKCKTCTCSH